MTTYNSYEAAKIANPESDIYACKISIGGKAEVFGRKSIISHITSNYHICDPSKHCMTVERFLADGHKFVEGDLILNVNGNMNEIRGYEGLMLSSEGVADYNCDRHILRAAALETKEPKRTKVEYVKWNFECAWHAIKAFEDGEKLYTKKSSEDFVLIDNAPDVLRYLYDLHERIETPIEWWEDASEFINQTDDDNCSSIMEGELHVNATLTQDQWCDFARILLEQELESDWQNGDRCNYGGVDGVVIGYCVDRKWIVIEHSGEVDTVEARLLEQGE